jgi:hypothetical protein
VTELWQWLLALVTAGIVGTLVVVGLVAWVVTW